MGWGRLGAGVAIAKLPGTVGNDAIGAVIEDDGQRGHAVERFGHKARDRRYIPD